MLSSFIAEFQDKYLKEFDDDFWGELKKRCFMLKNPSHNPSKALISLLDSLVAMRNNPIKVAIVGQFSSGKSSFLNAFFKKDLLPVGVVPVTAKPTYIKYAPNYMLKVTHLDGYEEILDINKLSFFVDQRNKLKDIKNITIYCPNEILKHINFIDTPGLNSRSAADTKETLRILNDAFSVMWISLIDNAARASERDEILLVNERLRKNSIFLLSQKDRLSKEEIDRVLMHSKNTVGDLFSKIIPFSSKMRLENKKDSGFEEIIAFLEEISEKREEFIKSEIEVIVKKLILERDEYVKICDEINNIIKNNGDILVKNLEENTKEYMQEFQKIYIQIKEIAIDISKQMMKFVKSNTRSYYNFSKTKFLKVDTYEKIDYESPFFDTNAALSSLIYNDDKLSNVFRIFKSKIVELQDKIIDGFDKMYDDFKEEILLFKGKYESYSVDDELYSKEEITQIAKIASEVYEIFLKDYERIFIQAKQDIRLFFEKIMIKIVNNYQNAVVLTTDNINNKILKSIEDYEEEPLSFSLYYPKIEEFEKLLLRNLNYYDFENEFVSKDKAFMLCVYNEFIKRKDETDKKSYDFIELIKQRHIEIQKDIKSL